MRSTLCFKRPPGSHDDRPREIREAAEHSDTRTTDKSTFCPWRAEQTLPPLRWNQPLVTRSPPISRRQAIPPTASTARKKQKTPAVVQPELPLVSRIINAKLVGSITSTTYSFKFSLCFATVVSVVLQKRVLSLSQYPVPLGALRPKKYVVGMPFGNVPEGSNRVVVATAAFQVHLDSCRLLA